MAESRLILGHDQSGDVFTEVVPPSRWRVWWTGHWRGRLVHVARYRGTLALRIGPFEALRVSRG